MESKFVQWLARGNFAARYAKNCVCMFCLMVLVQPILHLVAQHFGWGFAPERPFTSAAFWLNCAGVAMGSSLVSAFMLGTRARTTR